MFWKILCDLVLIYNFAALTLLPFDSLNALTLHVTGTDQHTLQSSQAKVIMRLRGQLLITQPVNTETDRYTVNLLNCNDLL